MSEKGSLAVMILRPEPMMLPSQVIDAPSPRAGPENSIFALGSDSNHGDQITTRSKSSSKANTVAG